MDQLDRRGSELTYSSHLKDHRNDIVPVYFNSTIEVGLQSSTVLTLVVADGAVAMASNDSEVGSEEIKRFVSALQDIRCKIKRTVNLYLIFAARNSLLAIMYRSRWVNEVDDILIVLVRCEEESEKVLVQTHGGPSNLLESL
jgi:hypothetical protein